MIDSITTNLFVVLVYFIPGSIVLFVIYHANPNIFPKKGNSRWDSNLNKFYIAVLSLFFGVLLHALTQIPIFGLESYLSKEIRKDWQDLIQKQPAQEGSGPEGYFYSKWKALEESGKDGYVFLNRVFDPVKNEMDYFFSEKLVKERAEKENETIYRLEAFYYLCRNSIIPLAALTFILFLRHRKLKRLKRKWIWCALTFLGAESILVIASCYYLAAKTYAVLAAMVVLR